MGDRAGAAQDWESALRANPREVYVFSPDRVRIFARAWNWSAVFFEWLDGRADDRSIVALGWAETALHAGQYGLAAEKFGEAMRHYTYLRDLVYFRGLAYLGMGDMPKALDDFRAAEQISRRAHIRRFASGHIRRLSESYATGG